mgnify:FL=1
MALFIISGLQQKTFMLALKKKIIKMSRESAF